MNRWGWAALVMVGVWLGGCGEGGNLPSGTGPTPEDEPGDVVLPGVPPVDEGPGPDGTPPGEEPAVPGETPPPPPPSLWPLTQGSTWTYRITDPLRGRFEKTVVVLGPRPVPGTSTTATVVRSRQPHLEELSWQLEDNGVVYRVREEDRKSGLLARVQTWVPVTVKSLSLPRPLGWSHATTVSETTRYGSGETETKEKTFVWRVAAVGETVTTPAGTFTDAVRLVREREGKEGKDRTYWMVPGVGKVKEDGERLEELLHYEVMQP
jgi:hypothetical protein